MHTMNEISLSPKLNRWPADNSGSVLCWKGTVYDRASIDIEAKGYLRE